MKINFISRKELINKLLDKINEEGSLDIELQEMLIDLSKWNG